MNQSENGDFQQTLLGKYSSVQLHRRTFVKRMLALGAGGSAALSLLAACGDNTATSAPAATTAATTAASSSGPVTLTIWDYYTQNQRLGYLNLMDSYEQANP